MAVADVDATPRISRSSGWRSRCTTASTRTVGCDRASCSSVISSSRSRRRCRTTARSPNTSNASATCSTNSRSASTTSTPWRRTSPLSTCAARAPPTPSSPPTPTTASAPTLVQHRDLPRRPSGHLNPQLASATVAIVGLLTPVRYWAGDAHRRGAGREAAAVVHLRPHLEVDVSLVALVAHARYHAVARCTVRPLRLGPAELDAERHDAPTAEPSSQSRSRQCSQAHWRLPMPNAPE